MELNDVFTLEKIMREMFEDKKNESSELYHHLRLDVIKAQICL